MKSAQNKEEKDHLRNTSKKNATVQLWKFLGLSHRVSGFVSCVTKF